jgi:N-acetylglutamate synthase-like GNAT family acetyltransferase
MNIRNCILDEELYFPKMFTNYEEKEYGILFFNENNKESYDSNHAVIHPEKINNFEKTIIDVKKFYNSKGIIPRIYQPFVNGYFQKHRKELETNGFEIKIHGNNKFMILLDKNSIQSENKLEMRRITEWDERIAKDIYIPSDEEYEIEREKESIKNENYYLFCGFQNKKMITMLSLHTTIRSRCTRFDYIIVSKEYRNKNYGKEILSYAVNYAKENNFINCYQWPANSHSEHICEEAGFRKIFEEEAGEAVGIK